MTTFRPHRGTLADSISAGFPVSSLREIVAATNKNLPEHLHLKAENAKIEHYGFDKRIPADCFIVTVDGYGVLGFADAMLPLETPQ